mmetsp:Transcript_83978/g.261164  ORF Transcript_83978/g.261164 Transcript_83978/m.261164 type:complete len:200 (+) Transcript_83978:116-715(+)
MVSASPSKSACKRSTRWNHGVMLCSSSARRPRKSRTSNLPGTFSEASTHSRPPPRSTRCDSAAKARRSEMWSTTFVKTFSKTESANCRFSASPAITNKLCSPGLKSMPTAKAPWRVKARTSPPRRAPTQSTAAPRSSCASGRKRAKSSCSTRWSMTSIFSLCLPSLAPCHAAAGERSARPARSAEEPPEPGWKQQRSNV